MSGQTVHSGYLSKKEGNGIRLVKLGGIFAETLFAFLAGKCLYFKGIDQYVLTISHLSMGETHHFCGFLQGVCFLLTVAFGAVEPLSAWERQWD